MFPLLPEEIMQRSKLLEQLEWQKRNVVFERDCYEQAKRELEAEASSGIDFVIKVLNRAQQIKEQALRGKR